MKNQVAIRMFGLLALFMVVVWLTTYPPVIGSGQNLSDQQPPSRSEVPDPSTPFEVAELKHDIEKGVEILGEKLAEKPKVIVKTKTVKVPVPVPRDSAAIWLRYPDGSVERIAFSTSNVPIINLVNDTITDTVKLKRKWVLFGPYQEL